MKILLAADGSKNALDAVDYLVRHARRCRMKPRVELVHVQAPLPRLPNMGSVVGTSQIRKYYRDMGEAALGKARRKLAAARLPFKEHMLVGPVAETLVSHARQSGCELVVVGSRGMSAVGKMLLGSSTDRLLRLSPIPVLVVRNA
jgi:nucleotide-binding universal stress UspA family protein